MSGAPNLRAMWFFEEEGPLAIVGAVIVAVVVFVAAWFLIAHLPAWLFAAGVSVAALEGIRRLEQREETGRSPAAQLAAEPSRRPRRA